MSKERIIIKIGSQSITTVSGDLNIEVLTALVSQIVTLMQGGHEVVLVSSGAVASGRGALTPIFPVKTVQDRIVANQILAAIGQPRLMQAYSKALSAHQILGAQVLVTKEDFRTRQHYLNLQNALEGMLQENILPIVNENDTVSIRDLMFTDNDELAGLLASQLSADRLILLTSVEGLLDGDPSNPKSRVISEVRDLKAAEEISLSTEKTQAGRGGMQSKLATCLKVANLGTRAHIACAQTPEIILKIVACEKIGTTFFPGKKLPARKKWLAQSVGREKGIVSVNENVPSLLHSAEALSLLPVGITKVEGDFERGDLIRIVDAQGEDLGIGLAEYDAATARAFVGKHKRPPFIRYEHLYINS
jgi:glutamate 5-kinase